jgi:hypothetical protein
MNGIGAMFNEFEDTLGGFWPTGETGVATRNSDLKSQPSVSQNFGLEMSAGIKHSKEVSMKARKVTNMTQSTTAYFRLKVAVLAAAVVGCLLVAPYTRAHEE